MQANTQAAGDEQARLWNGPAGNAWVDAQQTLDRLFEPLEKLLVEATCATGATRVLDVGCGTGGTTLAIARKLGAGAECTGIDISQPMIAAARNRAGRDGISARFICANAQTQAFEPASFDGIVSRLGVMFFDDPVRAFANLLHAAKPGAALRFIAWRSAAENPFMTTAERAAAPLLPQSPPRQPGAPGQFAFADDQRVQAILEKRLAPHRHSARRPALHAARERTRRLPEPPRPCRHRAAAGRRRDARTGHRYGARRLRAVRARRRGPPDRRLLAGRRTRTGEGACRCLRPRSCPPMHWSADGSPGCRAAAFLHTGCAAA